MNLKLKISILRQFPCQTDFAKATGLTESVVSRIVRERVQPTPDQRKKMADVLKTPEGELFSPATNPKKAEA